MKLEIEYIDIDKIKPYENNAKLHPQEQIEQIKASIKQFGMNDPIGIWQDTIVEGHGRLEACKQLGIKQVPIIRLDHLSDEQRKAYGIAHNQQTMNSGFDIELLENDLAEILNIDMSELGVEIKQNSTNHNNSGGVEFSEVLGEEHNYIVLYFDNDIDWLQAESIFDLKQVKCGSTRKDKQIKNNMKRTGVGRVLKGAEALEQIMRYQDANIN